MSNRKEVNKRYYEKNKERLLEQQKKYYQDNIEKLREYGREYYAKRKEQLRERKQEYYENYKDEVKQKVRKNYAKNREDYLSRMETYRKKNPGIIKAISSRWQDKHYRNDEIFRLAHLIRTRLNNAIQVFLKEGRIMMARYDKMDYKAILEALGPLPDGGEYGKGKGKYTVQHIIPLRKLDLKDPVEYEIAIHPRNVKWMLWEANQEAGNIITDEAWELYRSLRKEVSLQI